MVYFFARVKSYKNARLLPLTFLHSVSVSLNEPEDRCYKGDIYTFIFSSRAFSFQTKAKVGENANDGLQGRELDLNNFKNLISSTL